MKAILEILATVLKFVFAGWKKKNDPSVAQRGDQIAKDYEKRRGDLGKR